MASAPPQLTLSFTCFGSDRWLELWESFQHNGKGTGGIAYGSAEEAQQAISMLNGSMLQGQMVQVDSWVKKQA